MSKRRERDASRQAARVAPEQATVVIRVDQRVLVGVLVVLALIAAMLAGIAIGGRIGPAQAPAVANPTGVPGAFTGSTTDRVVGQAAAIQLGPDGQVQNVPQGLAVSTRPPSASGLDPNLEQFALADPNAPIGNVPRLTVSDLDRELTYDFGTIPGNQPVEHTFTVKNTGKADLLIGQVVASCGCTIPRFAGIETYEGGLLVPPLKLAPGESAELVVNYDPAKKEDDVGPIRKYIQIFSNDPQGKIVDNDPTGLSRELRFRITGNVVR